MEIKLTVDTTEVVEFVQQLKRAKKQRLACLKNAFKTIDEFAVPSLSPSDFYHYEKIKNSLIDNYKK